MFYWPAPEAQQGCRPLRRRLSRVRAKQQHNNVWLRTNGAVYPAEIASPMPRLHHAALGLLLACLAAPVAWWPSATAEVTGLVFDEHGVPAPGTRVRIQGTALSTRADAMGRFRLPRAPRVAAWRDGYLIAGAATEMRNLTLTLKPLPHADNEGYAWVDPTPGEATHCGTCHAEIYREWKGSAHARSATGTHFRDLYAGTDAAGRPGMGWSLLTEFPDGAGVCTACHAPAIEDGNPACLDLRRLRDVAAQGVHCDFCHKVAGIEAAPVGLTHGRFGLRLLRPTEGQLFFGPLDDVDRGEDAFSPLYRDSRYCASCHEGTVFGVHVYGTYSEWLASPARRQGKQCQDCHMSPTGAMTNIAPGHGGIARDARTLASHGLFAGSQADMLRRAVRVSTVKKRGAVSVAVTAEDVGHRVPTGFIDRHLLLVVEGFDTTGQSVAFQSGPTLPAAAGPKLAGKAGRLFGRLHADFDGRVPAPFWRAGPEAPDTRLRPGVPAVAAFALPSNLTRLRVRLLYRRFWQEVIDIKGWSDHDIVVFDEMTRFPAETSREP